jgi:thiosulfate/3-mercaptopyruvate sulfurtransferase
MDALVSTDWLARELGAAHLRVIDATWLMPGQGDAAAGYREAHIPGAVFLDLEAVRDTDSALPMMLPPADCFADLIAPLGIADDMRIVLYDNSPYRTAARAWFMLRRFGIVNVAILDGGLQKWLAEDRPVESGVASAMHHRPLIRPDMANVRDLAAMRANVASGVEQMVDARSAARFGGTEPDPRADTAAGHIPESKNLPIARLFEADGTYKSVEGLRAAFAAAGVDIDRPIVTTCGSGVTASVLAFALHLLGRDAALYDGSWSEWGALADTPKATA